MTMLRLTLGLLAASSLGACATNRLYDPFFGQPGAMTSVRTSYHSGWCAWDGTKQYVQTKGELLKLAVFGMTKSGTVPALSLRVAISDSSGRIVFLNHGGLQALVKVTAGGTEHLKPSQVFDDRDRNVKAVELALEPLVKPMKKR